MCTVYCTVYGLGLWDLSPVLAIQLVYFLPVSLRSLCVFLSGYKISKWEISDFNLPHWQDSTRLLRLLLDVQFGCRRTDSEQARAWCTPNLSRTRHQISFLDQTCYCATATPHDSTRDPNSCSSSSHCYEQSPSRTRHKFSITVPATWNNLPPFLHDLIDTSKFKDISKLNCAFAPVEWS